MSVTPAIPELRHCVHYEVEVRNATKVHSLNVPHCVALIVYTAAVVLLCGSSVNSLSATLKLRLKTTLSGTLYIPWKLSCRQCLKQTNQASKENSHRLYLIPLK